MRNATHGGSRFNLIPTASSSASRSALCSALFVASNTIRIMSLVFAALNRWVVIRVNVLGTALSAALAWYLTYVADMRATDAGFSLSMAGESKELQSDDGMMGLMRGRGSCV